MCMVFMVCNVQCAVRKECMECTVCNVLRVTVRKWSVTPVQQEVLPPGLGLDLVQDEGQVLAQPAKGDVTEGVAGGGLHLDWIRLE